MVSETTSKKHVNRLQSIGRLRKNVPTGNGIPETAPEKPGKLPPHFGCNVYQQGHQRNEKPRAGTVVPAGQ